VAFQAKSIKYDAFQEAWLMSINNSGPDPSEVAAEWAKRALRAEMAKQGLTYAMLAERLLLVGVVEEERNLRNKVARATFSAGFFVQCLAAMDCKTLPIDLLERWREAQFKDEERGKSNWRDPLQDPGKES
jgi:hypothetical protein